MTNEHEGLFLRTLFKMLLLKLFVFGDNQNILTVKY